MTNYSIAEFLLDDALNLPYTFVMPNYSALDEKIYAAV